MPVLRASRDFILIAAATWALVRVIAAVITAPGS